MGKKVWIIGGIGLAAAALTAGYFFLEGDRKKKLDSLTRQINFSIDPAADPKAPGTGKPPVTAFRKPLVAQRSTVGITRAFSNSLEYEDVGDFSRPDYNW